MCKKVLRFITNILKDILYTIGGMIVAILGISLILLVCAAIFSIFMLIPSLIVSKLFNCSSATMVTTIVGFITMLCVMDGKNPTTLIKDDIKSIKKYIITKWNESGQS